jgi:hypothetical protein
MPRVIVIGATMKVFISWSGSRSKAIAEALREWLPRVIQSIQPWMSATDIEKGTMWRTEIAQQLEAATVGIICLTAENLQSPWLLFEAGAISKKLDDAFVCTYLLGIEPSQIIDPLAQFQSTRAQKNDTKHLLKTINKAQRDAALEETILNDVFEALWPKLEQAINDIPPIEEVCKPVRSQEEILEELLALVRAQSRQNLGAEIRELKEEVLGVALRTGLSLQIHDPEIRNTIIGLRQRIVDMEDQIHSMVETHQEIPDIIDRLEEIHNNLHTLIENEKSLLHSKEVLTMVIAVRNLAYRVDEAQKIIEDYNRGIIESNSEQE